MPIPSEHQSRFAYHFTHLDNLRGIIKTGLLCPNEQKRLGLEHKSIALQGIQDRRATMPVTCGPGGVVHDYVPFYFCALSKMLLSVVNAKNVDQLFLIYLAIPIHIIERQHVVFTNASANTAIAPPFFEDPERLKDLAWPLIDSQKWKLGTEQQDRQRMAEILIHKRVDISDIGHIIVWNAAIKTAVEKIFAESGIQAPPIEFQGHNGKYHYLTKFYEGSKASIVTGPHCTKLEYQGALKYIHNTGQNPGRARFRNIAALLTKLREDFSCLPETAELVGLESENEIHKEDVGTHTLTVVNALIESPEFAVLNDDDKRLTELAAYLHDIGKGPRSRWADNGGKQKVDPDHPIGSVQMLRRILTEEIGTIKPRSVRVLAKLVCYHDLVGDILGKGRNPEQLEEIAGTERELEMLIALGLADMCAVYPAWAMKHSSKLAELRANVLAKLEGTSPEDEE